MKVNLAVPSQNSNDWERIAAGRWDEPMQTPDWEIIQNTLAIGDLAEPLGFDGIWAPEHFGTPFGLTPNPIQTLTYFAGRTERVSLGTMVCVVPWWNPIRLAHQIAYLDIVSKGRYTTIGLGRGIAKSEFEAVGVPREEARQRFNETLDILNLAFTQERFAYEGEIFKIPEMSIRPAPFSKDLASRIYGSSGTRESLEILTRRGLVPLFVGNKPIEEAGKEVLFTNQIRQEIGLAPCQPKNVFFMYCAPNAADAAQTEDWLAALARDTSAHYGFSNPANYAGVKGYESYAAGVGGTNRATEGGPKTPGYHASNYLIGTPDEIFRKIEAAQKACSFSEITVVPHFGTMPQANSKRAVELFAAEVLPAVHKMAAPIHASVIPQPEPATT